MDGEATETTPQSGLGALRNRAASNKRNPRQAPAPRHSKPATPASGNGGGDSTPSEGVGTATVPEAAAGSSTDFVAPAPIEALASVATPPSTSTPEPPSNSTAGETSTENAAGVSPGPELDTASVASSPVDSGTSIAVQRASQPVAPSFGIIRSGPAPASTVDLSAYKDWDKHVRPPASDNVPRAEYLLQERFFERGPFRASVPKLLEFPHRLQLLRAVSRIDRIPAADLVALAADWYLRGGELTIDAIEPPWNGYTGSGTPPHIPRAEVVLQQRFIPREQLAASVPKELDLTHRFNMYRVMNRLNRVPPADIASVALDRWLRLMGF